MNAAVGPNLPMLAQNRPQFRDAGMATTGNSSISKNKKTFNVIMAFIGLFLLAINIGFGVYINNRYKDLLGSAGSDVVDVANSVWARTALSILLIGGAIMIVTAGYLMCDTFGNQFTNQRYILGAAGVMNIILVWLFVIKPTSAFTLIIGSVINGISNGLVAATWGFAALK